MKAKLASSIKLVVPCNADVYESSIPSQGIFRPDLTQIMTQLVQFLNTNGSPFIVNIYPFLSLYDDTDFPQHYAFFEGTTHPVTDCSNIYSNVFDGNYDTLVAALGKIGYYDTSCNGIGDKGNISYAFNNFDGLGMVTSRDPSIGDCRFIIGLTDKATRSSGGSQIGYSWWFIVAFSIIEITFSLLM